MKLGRASRRLMDRRGARRRSRATRLAALAAVCLALLASVPAFGVAPAGAWPAGQVEWNSEGRGFGWIGTLAPELGALNDRLEAWGFPRLGGVVTLFGGGGYGAWENWHLGGFGAAGMLASREGPKRTELSLGFGALRAARVWPLGGVQLELGAVVGGGGATLILSEGEPADIDEALGNRFDTVIDAGFWLAGPSVGARIDLAPHVGLIVSAGYIHTLGIGWEHRGSGAKLSGLPDLNGAFLQVGIAVGGHGVRRR